MVGIEEFKRGVALMGTRPFGEQFAEELLVRRFDLTRKNGQHDLEDVEGNRIEVKTSRVFNKVTGDGIELILNYANKSFASVVDKWTANFQKIHPDEFDIIYFLVVFNEGVSIWSSVKEEMSFSNQHLNNKDMKQFSMSNKTVRNYDNHFVECLNWNQVIELLNNKNYEERIN